MPSPKFNDDSRGFGGHWSTKDITEAALVATFGFRWRGSAPIMHLVHANRLVSVIDRKTGRIEDAQTVGYFFDYHCDHPVHGRISCGSVATCYAKREMDVDLEAGKHITPDRIAEMNRRLGNFDASESLARDVCQMADGMENLMLIAAGVSELADDPLIQVAKALRKGRLDVLRPTESEPVAQRFLEKIAAKHN